jgi:thiamine pyrophosphate-dependent acetolactate synthase large subunit-like protein
MPVFVIGATGPVDADRRRPWIDWIHTARDQGALVRDYTKWDDQPASVPAAVEAMLRAAQIARSAPQGPVYVNLDVSLQEDKLVAQFSPPKIDRYVAPPAPAPDEAALDQALEILQGARDPLILMGRVSKAEELWARRIRFVEQLGARVVTDVKPGIAFPLDHPLQTTRPSTVLVPQSVDLLRAADVVLSLDWVDLAGTLKMAWPDGNPLCRVISVSMDRYIHNGWSMDHQGLPAVDIELITTPDRAIAAMADRLDADGVEPGQHDGRGAGLEPVAILGDKISLPMLACALKQALDPRPVSLLRVPISWDARYWPPAHPLDHIGSDGGGGIGSGPGMAIGSALALMGSGRLPVAILGDGDFLMGANALWTATHYRIPLLIVLYNNRSYLQDEMHQKQVAISRGRPVENRWIGLRLTDPEVDLAAMARSQGAIGYGPVRDADTLSAVFAQAIIDVDNGATVVVDVHCTTDYFGNTTKRV